MHTFNIRLIDSYMIKPKHSYEIETDDGIEYVHLVFDADSKNTLILGPDMDITGERPIVYGIIGSEEDTIHIERRWGIRCIPILLNDGSYISCIKYMISILLQKEIHSIK